MKNFQKDNLVYIDNILAATEKIERYCKNIKKGDFIQNDLLMDAVVRNLEIMGEAASKLTAQFKLKYRKIEWRKLIGMRNRIIHTYDNVNFEVVWDVVQTDLPVLKAKLKEIITSKTPKQ